MKYGIRTIKNKKSIKYPMFFSILVFALLLSTTGSAKASNELEHYLVTVQEPNIGPLHEVDPPVHQWIAKEAYDYFVSQIEGADITTYLGTISGSFTPNDDDFIEGTYAEDQENRDPLYQLLPWMRHYCAGADGSEIYDGLLTYRSNYDQALVIWNNYAIPDYPSNKARAFYRLGHVAHLLIDMTVPAHTHNDEHIPIIDEDTYEETIAYNDQYTWWYYGCTRAGDWNHPLTPFADLYSLFYRTANYTEDYDSDDEDGDGPPYYNPDDYPETWHRPGEVYRSDGLDATELTIIADDLMPYAIRRVADLYRLWYSEVDTSNPSVSMTYPSSEDPINNPQYRNSTSSFNLTASASDPQSGIVKNGYVYYYSYCDPGGSWSENQLIGSEKSSSVSFSPPYNNKWYAFTVLAENGGGKTTWSNWTYLLIDATNPPSPTITGYSDSGHSYYIYSGNEYAYTDPHFHFSSSDSCSGTDGYYYYWGTNSSADPSTWNTSGEYTASGLTANNTYYFRVKAKDRAGNVGGISTFTYKYKLDKQISGYVRTSGGTGISGVTMTGWPGTDPVTDSGGYYSGTVSYGWSGTITPSKTDYSFSPPSITYSNVTSNKSDNYTGNLILYTLSVNSFGASSVSITSSTGHGGTTNYTITAITSGTSVNLQAPYYVGSGASRMRFNGWTGSVSSSNQSITFTMDGNKTVTADYIADPESVATPVFTPDGGTYTSPVDVTISCGTADATIHYTTNGVDPTESDPVYSSPINISTTTTLKAKAWKSGWNPSGTSAAVFLIGISVPNIVGMTQADAQSAITSAGLVVGTVTTAYHNSVPAGNVISQSPIGGQPVSTGTPVNLVISLGMHYSGGDGTPGEPYQIGNPDDWQELMTTPDDWNQHFILTADVNLAGVTLTPVGNESTPFTGVFEGNDNIISNAVINQPGSDYIGLLGWVGSGGQIRNLGVEDVNITGHEGVGGLVGWNHYGSITVCYATGSVTGYSTVGGLVGINHHGTLNACYATGSVNGEISVGGLVGENYSGSLTSCYATGSVSGIATLGGLVGVNVYGTLTACYATGSVNGYENVGGLVGWNYGSLTSCYATGSVSGTYDVGGLVGENYSGTVTNCFWDKKTSDQPTSAGGTGKTTAEMQTLATFTDAGWDFVTPIWTIDEGYDYPRLWWEENILYVPGRYPTIQAAIDAAVDGDMVIVAPGTYTGNGNRDIDFGGKAITLRSENGPDNCIIDCNGNETEPHFGFSVASSETSSVVLEGLTVKNGYGEFGGGIRCFGRVRINNCVIRDNYGIYGGAIFSNNVIGYKKVIDDGGGRGRGGGRGGEPPTYVPICSTETGPEIVNCIIINNSATYGGGIHCSTPCDINVSIVGISIINSTIKGNSAIYGGGIYSTGPEELTIVITNSILWGNTATDGNEIALVGSTMNCSYSNIEGGAAGIYVDPNSILNWGQGNIDTDPLFVNPTIEDYHLMSNSPCIDAGDPNYPEDANEFDIDGDTRIIGGRIDMGADEYAFGELSDFNNDGIVNFKDFAILANYWMDYVCSEPNWCEGCDFDHSGLVDLNDLRKFAENWLWRASSG